MSKQRFQGKVALVTGGNSGIGVGVAKAYAREGAKVVITGRDDQSLHRAAQNIGPDTLAIRSDAGKVADIENVVATIREKHGHIDAMFINAGVGRFVPLEQITESFYDDTFNVNTKGVLFLVQKSLPLLRPGSAIVVNASINGHKAMPGTIVYAASKAAVLNLTKNLALELVERGIRVNSISPGPIQSAFLSRNLSEKELQETNANIVSQVPLKRFGTPEEIAAAVLYLTAPESAFVIGADLIIDGGMQTLS
jgi:NAD(P)-dependent dehydrogenase (short-subunit alcohol dehydrogenase family)